MSPVWATTWTCHMFFEQWINQYFSNINRTSGEAFQLETRHDCLCEGTLCVFFFFFRFFYMQYS